MTIFDLIVFTGALGGATLGFLCGRDEFGYLIAVPFGVAGLIGGFYLAYSTIPGTKHLLKALVRWGIMEEPSFEKSPR
jgi:hypothetical protein